MAQYRPVSGPEDIRDLAIANYRGRGIGPVSEPGNIGPWTYL